MKDMELLLEAVNLRKTYRRGGTVFSQETEGARFTAVDNVSFSVNCGETFAVVGESGCGKTTLARMLLRLIEPDGSELRFERRDLLTLREPRSPRASPSCAPANSWKWAPPNKSSINPKTTRLANYSLPSPNFPECDLISALSGAMCSLSTRPLWRP